MLQIVTKMYFREEVPLYSTDQREVLWTNRNFLRADTVDLPVGQLAPSTAVNPVSALTITITEHLEAELPDGERSHHVATGGTELIDDLADVLSFGLNSVFNRDRDLVEKLVPTTLDSPRRAAAAKLFRETFDPASYLPEEEIEDFGRFMTELLALRRDRYEAAIRAIRRIARATQRASTDPTLAYVDFVAALESLSEGAETPPVTWERMDTRKKKLFDDALVGADPGLAGQLRQAAMEAERLGFRSRFVAFVTDSLSPEFFREEAIGAVAPLRSADLERVLKLAYDVRSLSVHSLVDLPPEAWVIGNHAETVSPLDLGTMLSLEGLARLARHVVRDYVSRSPAEVDESFDWRARLPGVIQMRVASQYWIWNDAGLDHRSAERYLSGLLDQLVDICAGRNNGIPDMTDVLAKIEELVPGTAAGQAKDTLVAIYVLLHRVTAPEHHRPGATEFIKTYEPLLHSPGIPAFVAGLLSGELPKWSADQWVELASERREARKRRRHTELPQSLDACLNVIAAEELIGAGHREEAIRFARFAVEEMPGTQRLIAWERQLEAGEETDVDLRSLIDGETGKEVPDR